MKLSFKHTIIGFVGALMLFAATPYAFADDGDLRKVDIDTMLTTSQERYNALFLEAVRQQQAGHDSLTFNLLQQALAINPNAAEVYFLLSRYYIGQQNDSLGKINMERASALNPHNSIYLEGVAQYAIAKGEYDKAIEKYEQLYANNHDRTDLLSILMQLYQQQKNYPKMLSTLDRIETANGASEELTLGKMNVYQQMGDDKAAYNTLRALSDKNPDNLNYKVMLGNWLMQHNDEKEAYKIYSKVLEADPENADAQASLYDYYKAKGEEKLANNMLNDILSSKKTSPANKMELLQQVIRTNEQAGSDSIAMLNLLNIAMKSSPEDADLAKLNAAYMDLKKMPQDSINNALRNVLRLSPEDSEVRIQLVSSEWGNQNWDNIITLSAPAIEYAPEQLVFYYFMGMAYYQKSDTINALNTFEKGIKQVNDDSNPELVSNLYAVMGDLYQQQKLMDKAFAAYESCLKYDPNNIECLNNYAYFLSEEGMMLDKAEQMSAKTIKADPKSSTFLDTYAWILFLQKRYAEAKIYIDQAVVSDTDSVESGVILEHAGDIYYMNKNVDEAVNYWQKAQKTGDGSALLERKIKLKKYIDK